jgi:hypothetical protein
MNIDTLVSRIRVTQGCKVHDPIGLPMLSGKNVLPDDLKMFYTLCGGMSLFEDRAYPLSIVPPNRFVLANPIIIGEIVEDDISATWHIIGDDANGDYITIDVSAERPGRCYDSFNDCHGVAGSCPIIATSFTDLVSRLYENRGQYWYWLRPDFVSLGDAYGQ